MMRRHIVRLFTIGVLAVAGAAQAGTPLICLANDIGDAPSLPWGTGAKDPKPDYPADRLVADTLALLTPKTPVIVRMETIRRATLYARLHAEKGRPDLGAELLSRLQSRALDAEANGHADALGWFDAGYFAGSIEGWSHARARGRYAGYAWVVKAIRLRGGDAQMELAASLLGLEHPGTPGGHWSRASGARNTDPLLARNIAARLPY